jgi:hypothetical protein
MITRITMAWLLHGNGGIVFVGDVWWCEDCHGGGFGDHDDRRHRGWCRFAFGR